MEKHHQLAWDCLTELEQQCLYLNLGQGLSTWRAGEILKVTHYKYLELKARAEKLFKLFSDYFEIHPSLIRPDSFLDTRFQDYIYGCITKRLSKEEASIYAGDSSWLLRPVKREHIIRSMQRLKGSSVKNEWDRDLYALILEFDRWNNFRILPKILQAPSPYKRRNSKRDKVYLQYLHHIPGFKIRALVDMYWRAGKPENRYYVAFISTDVFKKQGYSVVPIKRDDDIIKRITGLKVYIFEDYDDADQFGIMAYSYFENTSSVREGLNFWKDYRELVERAINYREINNMDFTIGELDMAYSLKRKKKISSSD